MNRIKDVLKEQGRTQKWLADKLEMSAVNVNSYCNNRVQPRLDKLNQIANILGVDVKDLIVSNR